MAEERKRFRVLEWYECPTFDHIMSALFAGFVVQSGTMWYDNYNPGPDGWLPSPAGRAGGHATMSYRPASRTVGGTLRGLPSIRALGGSGRVRGAWSLQTR